ncbi:MAG: hypothetical protein LUD00_01970 [Prevotellaceae bacterium]|nr:hypothetical protein [Prevotellaceae bacterium]
MWYFSHKILLLASMLYNSSETVQNKHNDRERIRMAEQTVLNGIADEAETVLNQIYF